MLALLQPKNQSRCLYLNSSLHVPISSETNMFLENCREALQNGCPKTSCRGLGGLLGLLRDLLESFWEFWMALNDILGLSWSLLGRSWQLLGRSWQLSGPSWERLGKLLESFLSHVGVLLEVRRHSESVLDIISANIAKPSETSGGLAKAKFPCSRHV